MSTWQYSVGVALLGVIVASLAITGLLVRRMVLPAWSGAPARLAEAVIGIAALIVASELLGAIGLFMRWWLVVSCAAIAAATVVAFRRRVVADGPPRGGGREKFYVPASGVLPLTAAALVVALALIPWKDGTSAALHSGMGEYDTLAYHMPFAARFAQDASVTGIQYVWNAPVSFYPANSELIHAVGIVLFQRDLLSPVLNLAWLGMALLAGWCIGRPRGVGPATISATALLASVNVMAYSQAGSAKNDIVGLALLLAAVALLFSPPRSRGAMVLAALAGGLAVGTRLSLWAPVIALAVVAIVEAGRGRRRATAGWWIAAGLVGGGFWYARDLVATGNPLPWLGLKIDGLLNFHSTNPPPSGTTSVAHYITDPGFIKAHLVPHLAEAFGGRWWLVLGLATAGIGVGLTARAAAMVRQLALVALAGVVAYVLTPATAAGPGARYFAFNTRFAIPALALGVIALALMLSQLGVHPSVMVLTLLGALLVDVPLHARTAVLVAIVLVACTTAVVALRGVRAVPRGAVVAGFALLALVVVGVGWREQRTYLHDRYRGALLGDPVEPLYRTLAGVRHARIAVAGFYETYPLYGLDTTNRVDYPSTRSGGSRFKLDADCSTWLLALRRGHYDYVVTEQQGRGESPAAAWTSHYPGARQLLASPPGFVRLGYPWQWRLFRLTPERNVTLHAVCAGM